MNDQRIYKLLRTLADPQTDFKTLIKTHVSPARLHTHPSAFIGGLRVTLASQQECLRRLEGASPTIVATFTTLVERSSFLILNRSSVPTLLNRLRSVENDDDDHRASVCAKFFLDAISKGSPRMMTHHAGELVKALAAEDNEPLAQAALLALSELVKVDHEAVPADK